jgi:hypothetical protein
MTVTDKQGGPRPLHALVGDDKLAAWSDEGLTDADVRVMFERMLRERRYPPTPCGLRPEQAALPTAQRNPFPSSFRRMSSNG